MNEKDVETKFNDTAKMFFDEEFDPASYVDALFKGHDYSKSSLTKLTNISNNLIIHLNFLVDQLNQEINSLLVALDHMTHDASLNKSTRLNYYLKLLQNSMISLNNELQIPEFNQLVIINELMNFKTIKQNMNNTLNILSFIKKSFGGLTIRTFENDLLKLFKQILSLQDMDERLTNLNHLISCADVFKNLNAFNSIYRKNLSKFTEERDVLISD